jgi:hypothetical protein
MTITFDVPFIAAFFVTTIVAVVLIAKGVFTLIQFRDPKPVEAPAQE